MSGYCMCSHYHQKSNYCDLATQRPIAGEPVLKKHFRATLSCDFTLPARMLGVLRFRSDWVRLVGLMTAGAVAAYAAHRVFVLTKRTREQLALMQRKRAQAEETKTKVRQQIEGQPLPSMTYCELSEQLRSGKLSLRQVLKDFQRRALEVDSGVNAVVEMIPEAFTACDQLASLPVDQRGPLFGIPLSLKECIALEGYDVTLGCASHSLQPVAETHYLVAALVTAGMVPFARTNASQLARTNTCLNPIFGETFNPHDRSRTAGSSSGGEAALVAAGGSLVGLGTDIGGSVRIPAFFCGIFGFRPSAERVRGKRTVPPELDMKILFIDDSVGPLSSDFDLLVEIMRVFFSPLHFQLNNAATPLEFDEIAFNSQKPLRIGYYTCFDNNLFVLKPIPAVERIILETKTALEARGHTLVPWSPPQVDVACQLIMQCVHLDGGDQIKRFMGTEMFVSKNVRSIYTLPRKSYFAKRLLSALYRLTNPDMADYLKRICGARDVTDVYDLADAVRTYRETFAAAWSDAQLDGIICPMWENLAPRSHETESFWSDGMYSKLFNFIDYPSGTVPVGSVTTKDVKKLQESYPRRSDMERRLVESQTATVGLPLGVQCVAMKNRDEMALRIMGEVRVAMAQK